MLKKVEYLMIAKLCMYHDIPTTKYYLVIYFNPRAISVSNWEGETLLRICYIYSIYSVYLS